jgi:hypothetical protein
MKKLTLLQFAFVGLLVVTSPQVHAGSAVAIEPHHGRMATAYGGPVLREQQRALANARSLYGEGVRLLASTDEPGYCAVGTAQKGIRVVIAVSLGKRSSAEARKNVLAQLAKAGGVTPKIISRWRDSYERTASN